MSSKAEQLFEMFTSRLNTMSIFLQKLDERLKKIENKNVKFKPPTLIELEEYMTIYADSIPIVCFNPKKSAIEMLNHHTTYGWQTKYRKIKDWKAATRVWVGNFNKFSNNKNITTPSGSPKLEFKNQIIAEAKERFIGE